METNPGSAQSALDAVRAALHSYVESGEAYSVVAAALPVIEAAIEERDTAREQVRASITLRSEETASFNSELAALRAEVERATRQRGQAQALCNGWQEAVVSSLLVDDPEGVTSPCDVAALVGGLRADVGRLRGERDAVVRKDRASLGLANVLCQERDAARADMLQVALAVGIYHGGDGHGPVAGPTDVIVEAIKRTSAELAAVREQLRASLTLRGEERASLERELEAEKAQSAQLYADLIEAVTERRQP